MPCFRRSSRAAAVSSATSTTAVPSTARNRVNYLFSHPDEYQEMQENAYEYVLEHYDWDVILERFRVIIENVIEGRT